MSKCLSRLLCFISTTIIISFILAVLSGGFSVYLWVKFSQANTSTTTTYIGSSNIVQLGCWPKNSIESVSINVTSVTKVYSSDQDIRLIDIKLNQTNPRQQGPYYGYIIYNLTVQNCDESTDNCTLTIYMFDIYRESSIFLNCSDEVEYFIQIITTEETERDTFIFNFTLPPQYTYIAGSTTTTCLFSSNTVQLGCWPKNVTINTTSVTKVYSSDKDIRLIDINLNQTKPRQQSPYIFQVYYNVYNAPFFTVQEGYIIYSFTVETNTEVTDDSADNCTLSIYMFDTYQEFSKFLNGANEVKYFNRICLTTEKTEETFIFNFTLPSRYTYIAGIADSAVSKLTYFAINGSVTTYNDSQLNEEECSDDGDCSVSIGGTFSVFNSQERCVYVFEPPNVDWHDNFEYIMANVNKAHAPAGVFTGVAAVSLVLMVVGLAYRIYRWKKSTQSDTSGSQEPLLPSGNINDGTTTTVRRTDTNSVQSEDNTDHFAQPKLETDIDVQSDDNTSKSDHFSQPEPETGVQSEVSTSESDHNFLKPEQEKGDYEVVSKTSNLFPEGEAAKEFDPSKSAMMPRKHPS